jgi:hypothetical protein
VADLQEERATRVFAASIEWVTATVVHPASAARFAGRAREICSEVVD